MSSLFAHGGDIVERVWSALDSWKILVCLLFGGYSEDKPQLNTVGYEDVKVRWIFSEVIFVSRSFSHVGVRFVCFTCPQY